MITGASSGMGEAMALLYAQGGAGHLFLVARRRERLEEVKQACLSAAAVLGGDGRGLKVTCVVADVAAPEGWQSIRDALETETEGEGRHALDLLVLNAGLSMGSTFGDLAASEEGVPIVKRLMDVNFLGAVGCYDAALPFLQRSSQQRLLVVSSVHGLFGSPLRTGYAASKFALRGFFDALRCELLDSGAVVTVAFPGAVKTEINSSRIGAGSSDLILDSALSAEECARAITEAHASGARDVFFGMDRTFAGWVKSRALMWINFLLPSVADTMIVKTMRQMTKPKAE